MIQVIVRAIDILEYVAQHDKEAVQLYKIAEHVGLSSPTTANIVKTLLEKNYLEQIGRKKGYILGFAAYKLTGNQSYQQNLITVAKEKMEALTQELNETSILAMIRNNKRVILHKVECNQMLQVNTLMVADIYNTSTGRLLMAYSSPEVLQNLIKSIGLPSAKNWPGAHTKIGLEKELEKIRKVEFVKTVSIYHTVGFAVPVFQGNEVFTALSVFVPSSRYSDSYRTKILNLLNKTAKQISNNLQ